VRVVVNAVPARGTSLGIVTENLLKGWLSLGLDDELHLVLRSGVELDVADGVQVHRVKGSRLAAMELHVPALCRRLPADAFLGITPATTMAPLPCPRAVIALDLRHEARPQQFSFGRRLLRGVGYGIGYRQADAIVCISHRTHDDLLAAHPFLRSHRVTVAQLGARLRARVRAMGEQERGSRPRRLVHAQRRHRHAPADDRRPLSGRARRGPGRSGSQRDR
jgi:hypothetical protein